MNTVLPLTAAASCVFAAGAVLYSKIRPKFNVKVNCWFCQHDFVVPYDERNSWDCPHCEQYNGFTEDGNYNKIIAAQHEELLNPRGSASKLASEKSSLTSDPLCKSCSINQQLKIKQLASFVPSREERFEEEITVYKSHLDRVYKLCRNCETFLYEKLAREETWLKPKILQARLESSKRADNSESVAKRLMKVSSAFAQVFEPVLMLLVFLAVVSGEYLNKAVPEIFPIEVFLDHLWVFSALGVTCTVLGLFSQQRKTFKLLCLKKLLIWTLLPLDLGSTSQISISFLLLILQLLSVWAKCSVSSRGVPAEVKIRKFATPNVSLAEDLQRSPKQNVNELDDSIGNLKIGTGLERTSPLHSFSDSLSSVCSSSSLRKRPLISPSRLDHSFKVPNSSNLTKTSWVAGGYWHNSYSPSPSAVFPLSRSSSQSSGIGSIRSGHRGHFSPPASRPGSTCAELDCFSVCSDEPEGLDTQEAQFHAQNPIPPSKGVVSSSYTWGCITFLLGFSLAVNICICVYLYVR